jgi:hypothetical protein
MPYPDGFPTNGLISMSTIAGGFNSIAPHSLGDYYGADLEGWTDPDYVPPPATITNFEVASIPAGWVQNSTSAPSSGFSTTYGFMTAGNASNYPLKSSATFNGDYKIQASFQWNLNSCPDPSIAISPVGTTPSWAWGANSSRISLQLNCSSRPQIYGTSLTVGGGSISYTIGSWYTLHLHHLPSQNKFIAYLTTGKNDWDMVGTFLGGTQNGITLNGDAITGDYHVYLSSDQDSTSVLGSSSTNFSAVRTAGL